MMYSKNFSFKLEIHVHNNHSSVFLWVTGPRSYIFALNGVGFIDTKVQIGYINNMKCEIVLNGIYASLHCLFLLFPYELWEGLC